MSDLRAIADLYADVAESLEAVRDKAMADGDTILRDRTEHKQRLNDQAYFVLAWGQLEADIDDRRLSGLSFESRLMLVLEKGSGNWKRVLQHYNVRNQIAHGRLRSQRIDVSSVIQEFYLIQASLARN